MEEKKGGYLYSRLHQELVKHAAVKFRMMAGFPINKKIRMTSAVKCNHLLQEKEMRKEDENTVEDSGTSS